jgi:hypothetical protein
MFSTRGNQTKWQRLLLLLLMMMVTILCACRHTSIKRPFGGCLVLAGIVCLVIQGLGMA